MDLTGLLVRFQIPRSKFDSLLVGVHSETTAKAKEPDGWEPPRSLISSNRTHSFLLEPPFIGKLKKGTRACSTGTLLKPKQDMEHGFCIACKDTPRPGVRVGGTDELIPKHHTSHDGKRIAWLLLTPLQKDSLFGWFSGKHLYFPKS